MKIFKPFERNIDTTIVVLSILSIMFIYAGIINPF